MASKVFSKGVVNSALWSRDLGKSFALAAAYGGGADWGMGKGNKRFDDMRQIGGQVLIIGNKFSTQRKLFVARGKATGLVYVKNARKRFEPLCVDGSLSSGRTWKELELPDDYRRTDGGEADGGHVTVLNIVDAARERILSGDKPTVDWAASLRQYVERARKP